MKGQVKQMGKHLQVINYLRSVQIKKTKLIIKGQVRHMGKHIQLMNYFRALQITPPSPPHSHNQRQALQYGDTLCCTVNYLQY